jgi:xanthine dehydrogenase small subunit
MTPGELISGVHIPLPETDDIFKLYKISRRKDLDISAFTAAFRLRVEDGVIREARVAVGGVGPTIVRLPAVETFLIGAPLEESAFHEAGRIARAAVKPISDVRGSADYRLQLTENIFRKFFADVSDSAGELNPTGKVN